jgi:YD repeat-containing protein
MVSSPTTPTTPANRLLTRAVDPSGLNLVTTYGYDAKGQIVSVTDPKGAVIAREFDLAGQTVRQVVDPRGACA